MYFRPNALTVDQFNDRPVLDSASAAQRRSRGRRCRGDAFEPRVGKQVGQSRPFSAPRQALRIGTQRNITISKPPPAGRTYPVERHVGHAVVHNGFWAAASRPAVSTSSRPSTGVTQPALSSREKLRSICRGVRTGRVCPYPGVDAAFRPRRGAVSGATWRRLPRPSALASCEREAL